MTTFHDMICDGRFMDSRQVCSSRNNRFTNFLNFSSLKSTSRTETRGNMFYVVKGCMYIMFDMVDCYGRVLIVCEFLQESTKGKESSLHEI